MSYCRNNGTDSDVYVFAGRLGIECCGCLFTPVGDARSQPGLPEAAGRLYFMAGQGLDVSADFYLEPFPAFEEPADMIEHLMRHREAGHKVPQRAIDRLIREDLERDGK
jgi:hypothetical protein